MLEAVSLAAVGGVFLILRTPWECTLAAPHRGVYWLTRQVLRSIFFRDGAVTHADKRSALT